jgi:hypothetical protein
MGPHDKICLFPFFAEVGSYFTTDGQSVSMSWYQAPLWDLRPDIMYFLLKSCCLKFAVLIPWGVVSYDRTGLKFAV